MPHTVHGDPEADADEISQSRTGTVTAGAPQHALGVGSLPADWLVADIGSLNPFVTSGSRGWAKYYSANGAAFVRITNLSRDSIYIDLSDLRRVQLPLTETEGSRTQLQNGDLLISITADIGIVGFVSDDVPKPAYINQHIALVRFDPSVVDSKFVSYFLASSGPQREFRALTDQGAKAGMHLGRVRSTRTALPPLPEQRAIAAALSDVDSLLASLDRLIAKHRDVKQAVMQQLLTGEKRLPGFSGKWATTRMGRIGTFTKGHGLARNHLLASGPIPAIPYTAIYTDHAEVVRIEDIRHFVDRSAPSLLVDQPHLLIASSSNMLANIGKATSFPGGLEVAIGGDILLFNTREDVCFLSYLLSTPTHRKRIVSLSQGSTIRHVYAGTFRDYEIDLPCVDEQAAIVKCLFDIDSAITSLEQRCEKTRLLKQGMMQELLTGRTRLV